MANFDTSKDDFSDDSSELIIQSPCRPSRSQSCAGQDFTRAQAYVSSEETTQHVQDASGENIDTLRSINAVKQSRQFTKAEKAARKQEERKQRIRDAITKHKSSAQNCDDRLEVIVSRQVYDDKSRGDILKQLRVILQPHQITCDNRRMSNLISWRLKPIAPSSSSIPSLVPFSLLVFTAAQYVDHMRKKTLRNLCLCLRRELPDHKVMIVISGVDSYCKRLEREASKAGDSAKLIVFGKQAVQDSYAMLFLDYGIRTHDIKNDEELSHYICDVSHAVAKVSHFKNQAYLESILSYRRRRVARCTAPFLSPNQSLGSNEFLDESDGSNIPDTRKQMISGQKLTAAYLEMLLYIPGISLEKARAIQFKYPTLHTLLKALQNSGPDILSEIRHGRSNRKLGLKTSRTIAEIFTSLDARVEF